jgi:hypothetical protein
VLSDGSADLAEYGYVLPIHRVLATTSYDIPGHYDIYVRGSIKYSKNLGLYFRLDEESLVHELTHVLELTLGKKFGSLVKSKK